MPILPPLMLTGKISLGELMLPTTMMPSPPMPPTTKPTFFTLGKMIVAFDCSMSSFIGAFLAPLIVVINEFAESSTSSSLAKPSEKNIINDKRNFISCRYFAKSTARVSLMTLTFISPGYCTLLSIS